MSDHRYGSKFFHWHPEDDPRITQRSSRQRILDESRAASLQQHQKCTSQQRYFKEAPFPGTAAFDKKTGVKLPTTKRKVDHPIHQETYLTYDEDVEVVENADTWSDYVYHSRVQAELQAIAMKTAATTCMWDDFEFPSIGGHEPSLHSTSTDPAPPTATTCMWDDLEFPSIGGHEPSLHGTSTDPAPSTASADCSADLGGHESAKDRDWSEVDPYSTNVTPFELASESYCIYDELMEETTTLQESLSHLQETKVTSEAELSEILLSNHLGTFHDFILATQHPAAPKALRQLAIKYAMPDRLWERTIKRALQVLQAQSDYAGPMLADFAKLTYERMTMLTHEIPQMTPHWNLIKYNIREYFSALQASGINIPTDFTDTWTESYTTDVWQILAAKPPIVGNFYGDDQLVEQAYWSNLHQHSIIRVPKYAWLYEPGYTRARIALLMMSVWLTVGRKVATSFHAFVETFLFLGSACRPTLLPR